jgi:hypothetical protein
LYAQGRTLRQIVPSWAFPGLPWAINFAVPASPVSRRSSCSSRLRQQIVGPRDRGLTWNEVANRSI